MTALTQDRNTIRRDGHQLEPGVAANARIYAGAMAAINAAGFAVRASADATLKVIGMAEHRADNTGGADGDIRVRVRKGAYLYGNSAAGDAITLADVGSTCYVVDDQTVAKTNGAGARPAAGTVFDVDADGVWVKFS